MSHLKEKIPDLSDPKYLKYKGFKICDAAEPFFYEGWFVTNKILSEIKFKKFLEKKFIRSLFQ